VLIRPATIVDVQTIFAMLRASSEEQGGLNHLCATEHNLREDGFGPEPRFHVAIAEVNGEPAGLALYFFIYSTWTSRNGVYLEDLFVWPQFRRKGVARALMQHLAHVAVENRCGRMIWMVLRTNPAVRFYESVGADGLVHWMPMQITGERLRELATAPAGEASLSG
jgi:GNAT superfamily N-acetyltransferase